MFSTINDALQLKNEYWTISKSIDDLVFEGQTRRAGEKVGGGFPLFRGGCGDCGRTGVCGLCGWAIPPSQGHQEGTTKGGQTFFNIFFHIKHILFYSIHVYCRFESI